MNEVALPTPSAHRRTHPPSWHLLHQAPDGPKCLRLDAAGLYQFALMADIGFEYDRFGPAENEALIARCASLAPTLVDNLLDQARQAIAARGREDIVLSAHLSRGSRSPAYLIGVASSAPSPSEAALSFLSHYAGNVLEEQLPAFDDGVLTAAGALLDVSRRVAITDQLRGYHLKLLAERGLPATLHGVLDVGESVLLVRTRDLADYTLWLSGPELRQWLRDRSTELQRKDIILDAELPVAGTAVGGRTTGAGVRLVAHVSAAETIVFSLPSPRVVTPTRRIPTAAACAKLGANITPLRRKR